MKEKQGKLTWDEIARELHLAETCLLRWKDDLELLQHHQTFVKLSRYFGQEVFDFENFRLSEITNPDLRWFILHQDSPTAIECLHTIREVAEDLLRREKRRLKWDLDSEYSQ
jgi:hypothetical protein